MSDHIDLVFILFLSLFFGFMSFMFLKDVAATVKAKLRRDNKATMLTRRQMFYHVFIGILTGVLSLILLFGVIIIFEIRRNHP